MRARWAQCFGIPLAFIEHHVVVGNSLIGYKEQINRNTSEYALYISNNFTQIQEIFAQINNISDMTGEQAKKSHELYESIKKDLYSASLELANIFLLIFTRKY